MRIPYDLTRWKFTRQWGVPLFYAIIMPFYPYVATTWRGISDSHCPGRQHGSTLRASERPSDCIKSASCGLLRPHKTPIRFIIYFLPLLILSSRYKKHEYKVNKAKSQDS